MRFAVCVEASHKKGMGHLYRALNFVEFLKSRNGYPVVFVNNDDSATSVLKERKIEFETVDLRDFESNWETRLIGKYDIGVWINDRLETEIRHSKNVKKNRIRLITFDDWGSGAELVDINVAGMPCSTKYELKGRKVLKGTKWLILNNEIKKFKRRRNELKKIVVTLGGSDTYGVTIKVVDILRRLNKKATIITGPSFEHMKELGEAVDERFKLKNAVPSIIEEFYGYDLAITGGGMTPFEANASGLPCIIIANELHEIDNAGYLETLGTAVFAGYHEKINTEVFEKELDIEKMSRTGLEKLKTDAVENIYREIQKL